MLTIDQSIVFSEFIYVAQEWYKGIEVSNAFVKFYILITNEVAHFNHNTFVMI